MWLLAAVAFLGAAVLIGVMLSGGDGSPRTQLVSVPSVDGFSRQQAEKAITDATLQVGEVKETFSDTVDRGNVISTDPASGTDVAPQSKITLTISKGVEVKEVDVPDVQGQGMDTARNQLTDLKFKVIVRQQSSSVEKGTVVRTNPPGGSKARENSTVTMFVSSGPQVTTVPNVIGLQQQDAIKTLKEADLKPRVVETSPEGAVPDGTVMKQSLTEGRKVQPGSTVIIYVAKAQQPPSTEPQPGPGPTLTFGQGPDGQ
jgi:serine/threonine-protein kinase